MSTDLLIVNIVNALDVCQYGMVGEKIETGFRADVFPSYGLEKTVAVSVCECGDIYMDSC